MKILKKKTDKGNIVTIMSPKFYWNMCKNYLRVMEYCEKVMYNPKKILQEKVDDFIRK